MNEFQVAAGIDETNAKRSKTDEASGNDNDATKTKSEANGGSKAAGDGNQKQTKDNSKPPEPPKDYIHVRARRGEATDSHSLAERVWMTFALLYSYTYFATIYGSQFPLTRHIIVLNLVRLEERKSVKG